MKLLTHNHLLCIQQDCKSNLPLIIQATLVKQKEMEPKLQFIKHILQLLNYDILLEAASAIGLKDLPKKLPNKNIMQNNESFLTSMQKVLLQVHKINIFWIFL